MMMMMFTVVVDNVVVTIFLNLSPFRGISDQERLILLTNIPYDWPSCLPRDKSINSISTLYAKFG